MRSRTQMRGVATPGTATATELYISGLQGRGRDCEMGPEHGIDGQNGRGIRLAEKADIIPGRKEVVNDTEHGSFQMFKCFVLKVSSI